MQRKVLQSLQVRHIEALFSTGKEINDGPETKRQQRAKPANSRETEKRPDVSISIYRLQWKKKIFKLKLYPVNWTKTLTKNPQRGSLSKSLITL